VLNGIGGKTILEAKRNLTPAEFHSWVTFFNQYGSINTNRRLEYGFAMIAMQINNAMGGNKTMRDYMPHYQSEETNLTFEQAMEAWK